MMILLSLQTKLGSKCNIIVDRITELWYGSSKKSKKQKNVQENDHVNTQVLSQPLPTHQPSQSDLRGNNNGMPPLSQLVPQQAQPQPDFNNMYSGPQTHMQDAANPPQSFEPVAANDMGGAAAFFN